MIDKQKLLINHSQIQDLFYPTLYLYHILKGQTWPINKAINDIRTAQKTRLT